MSHLRSIYKLFTSFKLATVVLVLLTLITLLGTLEQAHLGLWNAVKEYFHSWFVVSHILENYGIKPAIPIPLPGGLLLMIILFINMTLGALVHVRKRARGIPNLITHLGILFLLVSSFVTFIAKNDGYVALFPGQMSNVANSYKTWQLDIIEFNEESQPLRAHVVPWAELLKSGGEKGRTFAPEGLPFSVKVSRFYPNATPVPASGPAAAGAIQHEIGGFKLLPKSKLKEAEANLPGCFAEIIPQSGSAEPAEMILSGRSSIFMPGESSLACGFVADNRQFGLQLVKTNWPIAYYIKLDQFIFERHPGTSQPKNYESRITRLESPVDNEGKKVAVRMNEPMRHSGFVVFQERYGQSRETGEYYSQFAVSDNPSDQWPVVALTVMGIGLTLQFLWKLLEFVNKSKRRRAQNAS